MTAPKPHTCKVCETPIPSANSLCPACVTVDLPLPPSDPSAETKPRFSSDAATLTPSPLPFPAPHEAVTPSPLPFPKPGSDTDLLLGLVFGGCLLETKIGQGGMGAVYRAHHKSLDRKVVVKILPPAATSVAEYRARFVREAQAAARLSHPNVVHVYDVGDERGLLFCVMELIDGESLDLVSARGPVPPLEAVRMIREAAKGLGAAHQAGIIHRDVKAANILLCSKGEVKVADFGVARDMTKERLSGSGMLLGTPAYMAPEQAEGHGDARSDLYSLGVTLFQLLTNRLPFEGDTFIKVLTQHKSEAPPSPTLFVPNTPDSVCLVIERLLKKVPAQRYPDVPALLADLDAVTADLRGTTPFPRPTPASPASRMPLIVGLLGVGAIAATWGWGRPPVPPSGPEPAPVTTRDTPRIGPAPTETPPKASIPLTLALDTSPEALVFRSPVARFSVSLSGDLPDDLQVFADGELAVVSKRSCSVVVASLAEGPSVIRVSARSDGREIAALGVAVTVDRTAPELTVQSPKSGQVIRVDQLGASRTLSVVLSASDALPIHVSARLDLPAARAPVVLGRDKAGYSGDVSVRPKGAPNRCFVGNVTLVVQATDAAGNGLTKKIKLVLVPVGMILVPGGPFETGSSARGLNSPPRAFKTSDPFFIDAYEVTNRLYQAFLDKVGGPSPRAWAQGHYRDGFGEHPVQGVSYGQATRFASFSQARLPTEIEWEKAAAWSVERGQSSLYPWGPNPHAEWANTLEYWSAQGEKPKATPVGQFRRDKSPYGCYDMGGNVQEWVTHGADSSDEQTLKGGCYLNRQAAATSARREMRSASAILEQVGFRCVRGLAPGDQPDP